MHGFAPVNCSTGTLALSGPTPHRLFRTRSHANCSAINCFFVASSLPAIALLNFAPSAPSALESSASLQIKRAEALVAFEQSKLGFPLAGGIACLAAERFVCFGCTLRG